MLPTVREPAASLDDFLQAHPNIFGSPYGSLRPRSIDHFIPLPCVQIDLLDASSPRALDRDEPFRSWESGLILEIIQCERLRLFHQSLHFKAPSFALDLRDPPVVPDEMQRVRCDGLRCDKSFRRFAVVRELQEVQHLRMFLLTDALPGFFGDGSERAADGLVPELPADTFEHRVGVGDRSELELRRWREGLEC